MKNTALTTCLLFVLPILTLQASATDEKFEKVTTQCIDNYLEAHPEFATAAGDHRFDDLLTDYSKGARQKQLERAKKCAAVLKQFGEGTDLSAPNRADLHLLRNNIAEQIFDLEDLKEPNWNPEIYTDSFADGIYLLVTRDFDTPANRIAHLRKRMEAIPRVIDQAKANLQHPPAPATAAAMDQVRAAVTLIRLGLDPLLNLAPEEKEKMAPLQDSTATALEAYMKWITEDLAHRSDGNFRLGPDKYKKKLSLLIGPELSPEEMVKRAHADLAKTRAALTDVAQSLSSQLLAGEKAPAAGDDKAKMIQAVADKIGEKHSEPSKLIDDARAVAAEALDFVKKHNLMTVPDTGVDVIAMPEFKQRGAFAMMDPIGALDSKWKCVVEVAPPPVVWPRPRQESFYREYNHAVMQNLIVREAMPGRCLQQARARDSQAPTKVRKIFFNHTSSVGWGGYCEQMMADAGFGGPEGKFEQLRLRLVCDCAAIIDQGAHAGKMNVDEALQMLKSQSFSRDAEAIAIWKQVRSQPAALSTDMVGFNEHMDLCEKAKAKAGASFDLKKYNDQVLSYSGLPVRQIGELMGL